MTRSQSVPQTIPGDINFTRLCLYLQFTAPHRQQRRRHRERCKAEERRKIKNRCSLSQMASVELSYKTDNFASITARAATYRAERNCCCCIQGLQCRRRSSWAACSAGVMIEREKMEKVQIEMNATGTTHRLRGNSWLLSTPNRLLADWANVYSPFPPETQIAECRRSKKVSRGAEWAAKNCARLRVAPCNWPVNR